MGRKESHFIFWRGNSNIKITNLPALKGTGFPWAMPSSFSIPIIFGLGLRNLSFLTPTDSPWASASASADGPDSTSSSAGDGPDSTSSWANAIVATNATTTCIL